MARICMPLIVLASCHSAPCTDYFLTAVETVKWTTKASTPKPNRGRASNARRGRFFMTNRPCRRWAELAPPFGKPVLINDLPS